MDPYVFSLIASDLIARRSGALDAADRRNVTVRSLALAAAGAPPFLTLVDTQNRVRAVERARLVPASDIARVGFQESARSVAAGLAAVAAAAQAELEAAEEHLEETKADLKEQQAALKVAQEQAAKLEACAEAVGAVFEES